MSEPADDDDDLVDHALSRSIAARAVLAGAALTVVVGFGVGFGLGRRPVGDTTVAASASTSTTSLVAPPTSSTAPPRSEPDPAPSSTVPAPTTSAPPSSTSSVPPSSTVSPPTLVTTSSTRPTAPSTVPIPPPTTTTTRPAPAFLAASWVPDPQGRLVLPRGGSASFSLSNTGGLQTQWLLSGSGFSGAGGTMLLGILNPGESTTVTVVPAAGIPEGAVPGTITVLGPNPLSIPFVIPA